MNIELSILSDNYADPGFLCEWGLSILVETRSRKVLFDTGASNSVTHNIRIFGKELTGISEIVLSHGHCDHTGGLLSILGEIGQTTIICHPSAFNCKYNCCQADGSKKSIGMPFSMVEIEEAGGLIEAATTPSWITETILTTGEIPLINDFEEPDTCLYEKIGSQFVPDKILDDLALIVNTVSGLIVITGCAHRGIINTLNRAIALTGANRIRAVIGGLHLHNSTDEHILKTARTLFEMDVGKIYAGHCTGNKASGVLSEKLGKAHSSLSAGMQISF